MRTIALSTVCLLTVLVAACGGSQGHTPGEVGEVMIPGGEQSQAETASQPDAEAPEGRTWPDAFEAIGEVIFVDEPTLEDREILLEEGLQVVMIAPAQRRMTVRIPFGYDTDLVAKYDRIVSTAIIKKIEPKHENRFEGSREYRPHH